MDYEEILKLLENAKGRSEHVIAINLDIRGFTPFCGRETPLDVATYITKIYSKIIKNYFNNALFYKLTGDGLIIIIPFTEKKLREISNIIVDTCLKLLKGFGALCKDEPRINFPTPDKIGIGLTRGSACCIISKDGEKILDYSGRILNLASRLMDIARPSGIVFDDSFGLDLLKDETKELFSEETGYVRGVAEKEPIRVYYTKKYTLLPESFKQPLKEPKWKTEEWNLQFSELMKTPPKHLRLPLGHKPLNENKIAVVFSYESPTFEGYDSMEYSIDDDEIYLERIGSKYAVIVKIDVINKRIAEEEGVPEDTNVRIEIVYPIK